MALHHDLFNSVFKGNCLAVSSEPVKSKERRQREKDKNESNSGGWTEGRRLVGANHASSSNPSGIISDSLQSLA